MPGGHEGHGKFEDFDIAALLNLMSNCTYFKKFLTSAISVQVIHVRNQLMHSPQLHVSDQNLQQYCSMVCTLFCDLLEKCFSEPLQSMRENYQTFLEAEQHLFKEKIESLIQRYESDQEGGIRTFLQQNTDLQEKLGPQMELLQMRVDHHEQQITDLNERVDQLEKAESKERDGSQTCRRRLERLVRLLILMVILRHCVCYLSNALNCVSKLLFSFQTFCFMEV
uniref:Uncharacterized protein n=1 Tax=Denticeps clupeoides TaxID=299321 RepID=A0AAY4AR37_9TELE